MSYLLSGLNVRNISEYDSTQSYEKFDIVDFQLNSYNSVYPSSKEEISEGVNLNDHLLFWFNNDYRSNFNVDVSNNIQGWESRGYFSAGLTQADENLRPDIDYSVLYTELSNAESLKSQASIFQGNDSADQNVKTIFVCFELEPHPENFKRQTILSFSSTETFSQTLGKIEVGGSDIFSDASFNTDAKIYVDTTNGYEAYSFLYKTPIILTISLTKTTENNNVSKTLTVRHNGKQIMALSDFDDSWLGGYLKIGDEGSLDLAGNRVGGNVGNVGIKYFEIFCYDLALNDQYIQYLEKYLFETYFSIEGLYFAKRDVPSGLETSPMAGGGGTFYWTKDVRDLFKLSYGCSANFSSKLSKSSFGDGYQSNISRNVNSLKSEFSLKYEGLTDKQAKCLIAYFENTPEFSQKNLLEGFRGVSLDLFHPYKKNAEVYFLDISHSTPYNNINSIDIKAESLYDSNLNYKGMLVELDEIGVRTYSDNLENFEKNDVVYLENASFVLRGYYFYIGPKVTGRLNAENGPLGESSYFTKNFYFKPDIDYNFSSQIKLVNIEYEGSTKQFFKNGINYNLLEFSLNFNNRSDREALAILKFLDDKAGFKIFNYVLPQPFNKEISVYCPEWSHVNNFKDNNNIQVKFYEFKNPGILSDSTVITDFNTKISFFKV